MNLILKSNMETKMKNLNQLILNFDYEQNFKDQDFYVSKVMNILLNY